jgi:hypothetical protein
MEDNIENNTHENLENTSQNDSSKENLAENNQKFKTSINDFINELESTFPEFNTTFEKIKALSDDDLFKHCTAIYPERFFDILYENEDMFEKNSETGTFFLPYLDFKLLWNLDDVSDNTKKSIWKYLQLVLFSCVGKITDGQSFGDTAKLFEAISEDDLQSKLKETMKDINKLFDGKFDINNLTGDNDDNDEDDNETTEDNTSGLPNPEDIQSHISDMLEGKIGQLASEIAEETSVELDLSGNEQNMDGIMKDLLKNPTKIMDLIKKVGTKLNDKIKSGELSESELLSEAGDILKKMKGMPGMGNMSKILSKMGMGGMGGLGGKGGKVNLSAMQNKIQENLKRSQTKERLQKKLQERQMEKIAKEAMEKARNDVKLQMETQQNLDNLLKELEEDEENEKGKTTKQQQPKNSKNKNGKKKKNKNKK